LIRFYGHISASSAKLLEHQRDQQACISNPKTEIYNFWNWYQAVILIA